MHRLEDLAQRGRNIIEAYEDIENAIEYFAESDLPNSFFLPYGDIGVKEKWDQDYFFWDSCAKVLIKRGFPKIDDVKEGFLAWGRDHRGGCFTVHCFIMQNRDLFFQNDEIVLDDLSQYADSQKREEAIAYFAESDLPNRYFLQQFSPDNQDVIFKNRYLWQGFAEVLVKRGFPKVRDVKEELFEWAYTCTAGGWIIRKFVIKNKQEFFPGEGLILEDFWTEGEEWEKVVEAFAASELPNSYFLQHFQTNKNRKLDSAMWDGFAAVLVKRGLPKINDVKKELLVWWQDPNWVGFDRIEKLVLSHGEEFLPEIKEVILQAIEARDVIWFEWLLYMLLEKLNWWLTETQKEKMEEILEYLSDDNWKEFESLYGAWIRMLCRS